MRQLEDRAYLYIVTFCKGEKPTLRIIQDPMKVDKPLISQHPLGRMAYGLMGFNYSYYKNVVEHSLDLRIARTKEAYGDARDAGAGLCSWPPVALDTAVGCCGACSSDGKVPSMMPSEDHCCPAQRAQR